MQIDEFPPRGSGVAGRREAPPSEVWVDSTQLGPAWDWSAGKTLLGQSGTRLLGLKDERHIVTIAGSQSGKSRTVLIPNLLRYPASSVVLDPKGELARATAEARRRMGHNVQVLDPYRVTGIASASFNPLADLGHGDPALVPADAAEAADAIIINNPRDQHWTDAAKNLVGGTIMHLRASSRTPPTLRQVRRIVCATHGELRDLFSAMADSEAFDGAVGNVGAAFLGKLEGAPKELQSILSTAQEQTRSFDDLAHVTDRSDFKLTDLRNGRMSIYLVLPSMRMGTHYRWLRLMVQLVLGAMERAPVPYGSLPVWMILEEFPVLGHMRAIESAVGYMAGFGVKLWAVLQDLTQLQSQYQRSWETFLANAGVVQCFGNADWTTSEYLSKRLGMTQVIERQEVRVTGSAMAHGDTGRRENLKSVRLLDPNEVTRAFARTTNRQLILTPERPPIYMQRLTIEKA